MKNKGVLFFTMMKIGLFTFGGGYAMLPLLQDEFVEKKGWLESDEFLDMTALAESTPGPIAVNAATYIGYKMEGVGGALLATLGVCIPSFVILYLISLFFDAFLSLTLVARAFAGIRVCVIYLILSAAVKMIKKMKKTPFNVCVILSVSLLMLAFSVFSLRFSTVLCILACGAAGLFFTFFREWKEKGGKGR